MPNRVIKESICTSDNIDQLTPFQEIVFYRLIVNCDDFGRFDARLKILSSRLFPLRNVKESEMADALNALQKADLITVYEVTGKQYLQMNTWGKHQQRRANNSKYPSPDEGNCLTSDISCNQMQSDDSKCPRNTIYDIRITNNDIRNTNTKERKATRFSPPTVEEVAAYCKERNNGVDPQRFVDFYESKGWMVGKSPMKSWKACVRTWEERDKKPSKTVIAQQYGQRDYSGVQDELIAEQDKEMEEYMKSEKGAST